jgi:predicted sugar kinase
MIDEAIVQRVAELRQALSQRLGLPAAPAIVVESSPSLHAGLGLGTQLTMSVAALLAGSERAEALARDLGRGRRSTVGLVGWQHGGMVIDSGVGGVERRPVPTEWGVLVIRPPLPAGRHGVDEESAFGSDLAFQSRQAEVLNTFLFGPVCDALDRGDVRTFGQHVGFYNREVGKMYASVQGGTYSDPMIEEMVDLLDQEGYGAAQSSWGPTVFTFAATKESAESLGRRCAEVFGLTSENWLATRVSSAGATIVEVRT